MSKIFRNYLSQLVMLIALLALTLAACTPAPVESPPEADEPDWLAVNDFLYQLQRPNAQRIGNTSFDLVIASIAVAGNSPETIPALKKVRAVTS